MDLDAKLYIEVADAIGRNQIDLLLELQNRLKNFGIKKPLWRAWFFPWFPVYYYIQHWRRVICCDRHIAI